MNLSKLQRAARKRSLLRGLCVLTISLLSIRQLKGSTATSLKANKKLVHICNIIHWNLNLPDKMNQNEIIKTGYMTWDLYIRYLHIRFIHHTRNAY